MTHEVIRRHPLFNAYMVAIQQCMKFMASGCENARISLKVIQNIHSMTTAIKKKYPPPPMVVETVVPQDEQKHGAEGAGYELWETWMSEAGNWSISSRKQSDARRLAATSGDTHSWRVETMPTEYTDVTAAHMAAFPATVPEVAPANPGFAPGGMTDSMLYTWPDELNALGLQAFESLQFPGMAGMPGITSMQGMEPMDNIQRG